MSGGRSRRVRRILGDLRRSDTRGETIHRIRRRATSEVRGLTGRSKPATSAGSGKGAPARKRDAWYVDEWAKLVRAVTQRPVSTARPTAGDAPPDPATAPKVIGAAQRQRAATVFTDAVARGASLEVAVRDAVDALAEAAEWHTAWSLSEGARSLPGGSDASAIGHAVIHHRRRQFERAWPRLEPVRDEVLAAVIPVETVDAALAVGTDEARRRALAISTPTDSMPSVTLVDLAGRWLAFGERDTARSLITALRGRAALDLDPRRRYAWSLIERWLDPPTAVKVPAGATPIAILDYHSPDHVLTSGNLGDHMQTLGLLSNLVRSSDVTFTGEEGLGDLARDLQARVRADLRRAGSGGAAHLLRVDRDFSSAADVPDGTWMFAFGWHMHPLFDLRYDFPYHSSIRPLFVSFHVNRLAMLSEDGLAYLRQHAPIGCRDWTTVFLLLSVGIDAFFSGCVTTTVDALFPPRAEAYTGGGAVGLIDVPRSAAGRDAKRIRTFTHQAEEVRYASLAEGLQAASDRLGTYLRDLDRAVTGRLHAYLPLTALGVPTEFRNRTPGDIRFAGLTDLHVGDPRLDAIRGDLRELISSTFEQILGGADEATVRAAWRERTAPFVAEARRRFEAEPSVPPPSSDVTAAIAKARTATRRFGPHDAVDPATITDVVIAYDANLLLPAAVMLESLVANASGPLRVWVLGRGLPPAYEEWLAGAFPSIAFGFVPCDDIAYGETGRPSRVPIRITISTMDRIILPALLEDVPRVVYLDVDTLLLDDVVPLARTDLGGRPFAVRDSNVGADHEWQRTGRRLPQAEATELRRSLARRHGVDFPALNAGVMVLDLDRLRRDGFMTTALSDVWSYGFHDQDVMLWYAGRDRAGLDARWNAMPVIEDVDDPRLIHWASFPKPWDAPLTYQQSTWAGYASSLRDRAGTPPAAPGTGGPDGSLGAPTAIGPTTTPLAARVESVIAGVRREHLSYLDVPSLRTLAACVQAADAAGVEGIVIEAGTALGGSAITIAAAKAPDRPMRVYDVFGMIPPPDERDGTDVHRRYETITSGASKGIAGDTYYGYHDDLLNEVTASFARHGVAVEDHDVTLVRGLFQDTMELDGPVAFAHLDGDWYASTMTCLTRIVPRLSVGGRIVVDDYDTWSGCRTAVDEYFAGRTGFRFERRGRLHIVRV